MGTTNLQLRLPKAAAPVGKIPTQRASEPPKKWEFSFQYWKQRDKFGFNCAVVDKSWIASFFERLSELSKEAVEQTKRDPRTTKAHRMHKVDFSRPQVQVTREEFFHGIPSHYNNPEDYDVIQFQVSRGSGRVFGFLDEAKVFQVVYIDPNHVFELSGGKFEYKERGVAGIQENQISKIEHSLMHIKKMVSDKCPGTCAVKQSSNEVLHLEHELLFVKLADYISNDDIQKLQLKHGTIEDALMTIFYNALSD